MLCIICLTCHTLLFRSSRDLTNPPVTGDNVTPGLEKKLDFKCVLWHPASVAFLLLAHLVYSRRTAHESSKIFLSLLSMHCLLLGYSF